MKKSKNRLKQLEVQKEIRDKGGYVGLPLFKFFPKFGKIVPVLPKGLMVLITANSGVGKTQLWKSLFLMNIIKYVVSEKTTDLKIHFKLILLEESEEEFIDSIYSIAMYEKYGLIVDKLTLNSMRKSPLSDDLLKKLKDVEHIVDKVLSYVDILDSVYNPFGIYSYLRSYSEEHGDHVKKTKIFTEKNNGKITKIPRTVYSHYQPHDPNQEVIVIVDNLNLLSPEKGDSLRDAMGKWSFGYCRKKMSKHWGYRIINIQQQAGDSEKQEYTYKGANIINRVKPSLDGLGDNKATARDHLLAIGLFAPIRYNIEDYKGYDISKFRNNFRSLLILKNRLGIDKVEIPLYFHGAACIFKELEHPDKVNINNYELIKKI